MTDRCDSLSNHRRIAEEKAGAEVAQRQAAEREAEVRRNNYFASGTDEGGSSSRASSDPGRPQTSSNTISAMPMRGWRVHEAG